MRVNYSGGAIKVSLWRLIATFCNCCDTFIRIPCELGYAMKLITMNGVATGRGYLSDAKRWDWLYKEFPLSLFTKDLKESRRDYRKFMGEDDGEEMSQVFQKKKFPSILGKEDFVYWVKNRYFERKVHIEVPDLKLLAPDKERIQGLVCRTYGITKGELVKSKRGTYNEPRGVAIYLTRMIRSEGLMDICKDYNLKKYSSASSVVENVKKKLLKDRKFRKRVNELSQKLIKSQPET